MAQARTTPTRESNSLLDSIRSVLIGIAPDDTITHWNRTAAEVFGTEPEAVMGRTLHASGIPWNTARVRDALAECRAGGDSVQLSELDYRRPDGSAGLFRVSISPIGRDAGVLLHATDITETRTLELQLIQAHKLESIGQLAAGIAHEINTPTQYVSDNTRFLKRCFRDLTGCIERLQGLAEDGSQPADLPQAIRATLCEADVDYLSEEIPRAIAESMEGLDRVTRIVRSMKEFSHPGSEQSDVDINRAVETTILVARNEWKHVARMVTDLDPAMPLVPGMPGGIKQVILNMVVNAAHAIAERQEREGNTAPGTITLSSRVVGDSAEIRVSDTGTGIREELTGRIFDPFFTTKKIGQGTGQGLSIAHNVIVKEHGGSISIETELGHGTTFVVRLPLESRTSRRVEAVS